MSPSDNVREREHALRQKIAGKSIPMEKLVARKVRNFLSQGDELVLPGLELAYLFMGIAHAPRKVIVEKMLPEVESVLRKLGWESASMAGETKSNSGPVVAARAETTKNAKDKRKSVDKLKLTEPTEEEKKRKELEKAWNEGKGGYWDDFGLARFLEAVCLRYIAYPDPDAILDPTEEISIPKDVAERGAERAFRDVFEYGPRIDLDHHIVYHAHYELGRLLACQGKVEEAKVQLELVLSGKPLEVGASGRKGKYSMENALHMRTHAAFEALQEQRDSKRL